MFQRRDVAIHASILLIATGGLFLLANLGAFDVGPRQGWPIYPALVGVLAWADVTTHLSNRETGKMVAEVVEPTVPTVSAQPTMHGHAPTHASAAATTAR